MPTRTHDAGPVIAALTREGFALVREGFALARELFGSKRKPHIWFSSIELNGEPIFQGVIALTDITLKATDKIRATIIGLDLEGNDQPNLEGVSFSVDSNDTNTAFGSVTDGKLLIESPSSGGALGLAQLTVKGTLPNGAVRSSVINVTIIPGDVEDFRFAFDAPEPAVGTAPTEPLIGE